MIYLIISGLVGVVGLLATGFWATTTWPEITVKNSSYVSDIYVRGVKVTSLADTAAGWIIPQVLLRVALSAVAGLAWPAAVVLGIGAWLGKRHVSTVKVLKAQLAEQERLTREADKWIAALREAGELP